MQNQAGKGHQLLHRKGFSSQQHTQGDKQQRHIEVFFSLSLLRKSSILSCPELYRHGAVDLKSDWLLASLHRDASECSEETLPVGRPRKEAKNQFTEWGNCYCCPFALLIPTEAGEILSHYRHLPLNHCQRPAPVPSCRASVTGWSNPRGSPAQRCIGFGYAKKRFMLKTKIECEISY